MSNRFSKHPWAYQIQAVGGGGGGGGGLRIDYVFTRLMAHLAATLWRVQPTAMGLIPPPRLDTGIRDAPKKKGILKSEVSPPKNDVNER